MIRPSCLVAVFYATDDYIHYSAWGNCIQPQNGHDHAHIQWRERRIYQARLIHIPKVVPKEESHSRLGDWRPIEELPE